MDERTRCVGYSLAMHTTAPRRSRLTGILLTLAVGIPALTLASCSGNVSDRSIEPISQAETTDRLRENAGSTLLLDARDARSFDAGHLPGARLTRLSEIDLTAGRPRFGDDWDMIVVYGQDPGSAKAPALVKRLLQQGHKNVALLEGGFAAWVSAGLPTER